VQCAICVCSISGLRQREVEREGARNALTGAACDNVSMGYCPLFKRIYAARLILMLLLCAISGAAQQPAGHVAPLAPSEHLQNLDALKQTLKKYHDCIGSQGCYSRDLDREADRAIAFLRQRTAHNPAHKKLAIVLDIDETTLSNYEEMLKAGFAYDSRAFNEWVETASAPAIPGTLRLVKEAEGVGVSVIFLTGRPDTQRAATEKNLQAQGFAGYAELRMRAQADAHSTAVQFKSEQRRQVAAEGYTIVLSVGDQWSDLRGRPEAEYSVKYPNPYYLIP